MRLYIVRHGEAQRQAPTDAERALTAQGRATVEHFWRRRMADRAVPMQVVTSPLRRARETARIIADVQADPPTVTEQTLLTPEAVPEATLEWLADQPDLDNWVLVSHMPLVALLTGLWVDGPGGRYGFPLAGVACLEVEAACPAGARLLWLEAPEADEGGP